MSELERICSEVLHLTPRKVEPVRTQSGERVHRVVTADRVVYVKHGRTADTRGRFRLEAWAYEQCRTKGVLVPEVLAASGAGDEFDYMATLPLAGRPIEQLATGGKPTVTGKALTPILRTAGEQLRAMHEIDVNGAGPIVGTPPRGAYVQWCPFFDIAREALPGLVEDDVLSEEQARSLDTQLSDAAGTVASHARNSLLHGDLEGDHLFSHRGRFTGFIDFEKMQAGDPVFDLARLAWWDPHMVADVVDGYGRDALTDEDIGVRMPAYLIANAVVGSAYGVSAWLAAEEVTRAAIRSPAVAANFIATARVRNFRALAGGGVRSPLQMLIDAVNGKTDDEIALFATAVGGFGGLCHMVFQGMKAGMKPKDCNVGFMLGDAMGWVFRAANGRITIARRVPKRAPAILYASPPDFLRMVTAELDWQEAADAGRIRIEGDPAQVAALFAGRSEGRAT